MANASCTLKATLDALRLTCEYVFASSFILVLSVRIAASSFLTVANALRRGFSSCVQFAIFLLISFARDLLRVAFCDYLHNDFICRYVCKRLSGTRAAEAEKTGHSQRVAISL